MQTQPEKEHRSGRRDFLKQSGLGTAGVILGAATMSVPFVHAAGNNTIKVALVGCGGRGRGAAQQALNTGPDVKLWAVADAFPERAQGAAELLKNTFEGQEKGHLVDVSPDRVFDGLDGYKKAMDTLEPGDVVLEAGSPAFRPMYFAYAVEKGLHIFAEKALAVDVPGLKELQKSNEKARAKNLKVAVGLNNRHHFRTEEAVREIYDGRLGDISTLYAYRSQPRADANEAAEARFRSEMTTLQYQLRRMRNFNWLAGGLIADYMIHNLDICCWINRQLPVAALGTGGRLFRREKNEAIDNAHVQFTFADGRKMMMYLLLMANTWAGFRSVVHGSKGGAIIGEGVTDPRFYADWNDEPAGEPIWTPRAGGNSSHQTSQDRFFQAIRENREWNEMDHGISATFTSIMARMAIETGNRITAEEAWASTFEYAPNIAEMTMDSDAPVMPDADGFYQIPRPGRATINNPYQT